jgi:hypothetical protein
MVRTPLIALLFLVICFDAFGRFLSGAATVVRVYSPKPTNSCLSAIFWHGFTLLLGPLM